LIFIYDHNKAHVMDWVKGILDDPAAAQYVAGTALHWYDGDHFDQVGLAHQAHPEKLLLASEATAGTLPPDPAAPIWSQGEDYAHDILGELWSGKESNFAFQLVQRLPGDLNNWVVGWIDWNILLDQYGGPRHTRPDDCEGPGECGCSAMMMANMTTQQVHKQAFYYYMGHFSKFMPPGSQRLGLNSSVAAASPLEHTVFLRPDKQTSLVVMNPSNAARSYQVGGRGEEGRGR
jgi:glucosylceramidase